MIPKSKLYRSLLGLLAGALALLWFSLLTPSNAQDLVLPGGSGRGGTNIYNYSFGSNTVAAGDYVIVTTNVTGSNIVYTVSASSNGIVQITQGYFLTDIIYIPSLTTSNLVVSNGITFYGLTGFITNVVNGFTNAAAGLVGLLGPTNFGNVRVKGLAPGANVTLTDTGTNIIIASSGGGGSVAAPFSSVQFNSNGVQQGSQNVLYNNTNNSLIAPNLYFGGVASSTNTAAARVVLSDRTVSFFSSTGHSLVIGNGGYFITTNAPNPASGLFFETNGSVNGAFNTLIGFGAGLSNRAGNMNVFIGHEAGRDNTIGDNNTFIGAGAGLSNITGFHNTYIGAAAGGIARSGSFNAIVGTDSGLALIDGDRNSFFGNQAGAFVISGSFNTFLGNDAAHALANGSNNVAVGRAALYSDSNSFGNSVVGSFALYDVVNPNASVGYNTALGYNTGRGIVSGTKNTIIGANVSGLATNLNQAIIIADGDGNQRINANALGFVGVGTGTNALAALHVAKGTGSWGGINDGGAVWITSTTNTDRRLILTHDPVNNIGIIQAGDALVGVRPLVLNPSGGNVGIGTLVASSALDVIGQVRAGSAIITNMVGSGDIVAVTASGLLLRTNITGGGGSLQTNATQFAADPVLAIKDGVLLTNVVIKAATNASLALTVNTNVFVITGGNVGIGTASPSAALHVAGVVIGDGGFLTTGASAEALYDNTGPRLRSSAGVQWGSGGTYAGTDTKLYRVSSGMVGTTNFYASGLVGIGTNAPAARLQVTASGANTNIIRFGTIAAPDILQLNTNETLTFQGTNLSLPNLRTNATPVAWLATDAGGAVFETAASGLSVSGNSNQIPYLNAAGTGFLFGSTNRSSPGFGFSREYNSGSGAFVAMEDLSNVVSLVTFGPGTPGSSIVAFTPSLTVTNRYGWSGSGDKIAQEQVRIIFTDISDGSNPESLIQTWYHADDTAAPVRMAGLRRDGRLTLIGGLQLGATNAATSATLTNMLYATTNINFPSTAAGTVSDAAVSVPGAADGEIVSLGIPSNAMTNGVYCAWASNDAVYIRFANNALVSAADPGAGVFRVRVDRFK